jgi:hypothetical protein
MNNSEIIEKLYKVQLAVRAKNASAASAMERSIIPLLEHDASLYQLSEKELIKIKGVGKQIAGLIIKIIAGAPLYELVECIDKRKKKKRTW